MHRSSIRPYLLSLFLAIALALSACDNAESPSPTALATTTTAAQAGVSTPQPTTPAPTFTAAPTSTAVPPTATATATAPLSMTATPAPVLTPTARPPIALKDLAAVLADESWNNLVELTDHHIPRASATDQEAAAAEYLLAELRSMGYEAALEPFTFEHLTIEKPVLKLNAPEDKALVSFPMVKSGEGAATGALVDIGIGRATDIPAGGITGKIALAQRGTLSFEEKAVNAAAAGAIAIIVYNNADGYFGGTLTNDSRIPVVSINRADGESIRGILFSGQAVTATVTVEMVALHSRNVVAEKPGTDHDRGVVILGGHFDTVPDVPGANDNGSGTATLLAIASEISGRSYPFTVRLIAFGSEELGLYGSKHHVAAMTEVERAHVIAMLNFDALGTGPTTGILGDSTLLEMTQDVADAGGIDASIRMSLSAGTSSDHASFIEAKIPSIFFLGDDFSRIHTPNDKLEFVRRDLMGNAAALGIGLLDAIASRTD